MDSWSCFLEKVKFEIWRSKMIFQIWPLEAKFAKNMKNLEVKFDAWTQYCAEWFGWNLEKCRRRSNTSAGADKNGIWVIVSLLLVSIKRDKRVTTETLHQNSAPSTIHHRRRQAPREEGTFKFKLMDQLPISFSSSSLCVNLRKGRMLFITTSLFGTAGSSVVTTSLSNTRWCSAWHRIILPWTDLIHRRIACAFSPRSPPLY